jgi:nitric oxide reductase NorD protein
MAGESARQVGVEPPRFVRPFLRALWQQTPAVGLLPPQMRRTALREGSLLLPGDQSSPEAKSASGAAPRFEPLHAPLPALQLAAAAHAGAHLAHGGEPFERQALKPVQIALLGLLEDARVEWLAARELPGLRALWLAYHEVDAGSGNDAETLMARVARCLLDPRYLDPHPWVQKARRLFFADGDGRRLALDRPTALRQAASLLGNDLGQMRLQFNDRLYLPAPRYRDDNGHLWRKDVRAVPATEGAGKPQEAGARPPSGEGAGTDEPPLAVYPEWDRLIGRLRREWVRVYVTSAALPGQSEDAGAGELTRAAAEQLRDMLTRHAFVVRRLRRSLPAILGGPARGRRRREYEGDDFHLDALVEARIERQGGRLPDPRVHLQARPSHEALSVLILIDASASTARPAAGAGSAGSAGSDVLSVLHAARLAGLLLGQAIEAAGHECAVEAFASNGRKQVVVHPLKSFAERCEDPCVVARAAALRSSWSTRLGAVVRHAGASLAGRAVQRRIIVLLTDGEPHDIDVHDPRYLVDDLQHALREVARDGTRVVCLDVDGAPADERREAMRRVFGAGAYRRVGTGTNLFV